ncbi:GlxA family transcriptional regulator [Euzebya tangerina]|uniref:GlxA family transcriptional regulator n=1 Tax=Euzebya tangerina TaxID=591198 RepID=UPI000E3104CB|nr:helix-turn-helix domain-containing protein [Euzebya tangerina]
MRVDVAVVDGVLATGVSSVVDVFSTAESVRGARRSHAPPITVTCVGSGQSVVASNGMTIPCTAGWDGLSSADVVVVPGFGIEREHEVAPFLRRPDVLELVDALGALGSSEVNIAAACAGSFLAAEAGLLEHRRATTTWWLSRLFRVRYPRVDLAIDEMVVRDGPVLTAGAAFGHVDLALAIVASISAELATTVGRYLAVDQRTRQGDFIELAHLTAGDSLVAAFDRLVVQSLARSPGVNDLAGELGTTRRTLERRVQAATGLTPLGLIRRRRAGRARDLLAETEWSTSRVAAEVGYRNASTLRRLLRVHG